MMIEGKTDSKKYAYETPFLLLSLPPQPISEKEKKKLYRHTQIKDGTINKNI